MSITEDFEFQVYLKSKAGISQNNTPAWVQFDLSTKPLQIPDEYRYSVSVIDCCVKNTWNNINSTNNSITVDYYTTDVIPVYVSSASFTITADIYTVYTLATEMKDIMGANWTVAFDGEKYTFSHTTYNFLFTTATTADDVIGVDLTLSDAARLSTAKSYACTLCSDVTYTTYVYITSPELTNLSKDTYSISSVSDVLAAVQITVNSTGIVFYRGDARTILNKTNISQISIILKDENNNILPLQGGWWNMTLDFRIVPVKFLQDVKTQLRQQEIEQNGLPKPAPRMIPVPMNQILKPALSLNNINNLKKRKNF